MSAKSPMLHLLCGKVASGKSTLAAELARAEGVIVIAEDVWLDALYSDEMSSIADYVRCSAKLRKVMAPHIVALLNNGASVVLDFQANTRPSRKWMRDIIDHTNASHILHVLDVADEICIARLRARNARGDHPFAATEEQFSLLSKHFTLPSPDEGFKIVLHQANEADG